MELSCDRIYRFDICPRDVFDMYEVSGLFTIAIHCQRLFEMQCVDPITYDTCVRRATLLSFAIDVEVSKVYIV